MSQANKPWLITWSDQINFMTLFFLKITKRNLHGSFKT